MKISVITPVYNTEKYLEKCLKSVIAQTYPDWEMIAVNDGSQDSSYQILTDFSKRDPRIRIFTQPNQGPGMTRNKAISYATGDYLVFLDSDDYLDKDYFAALSEVIARDNPDVIFIDVIQETPEGKLLKNEILSGYKTCSKNRIIRHQMTGKLPWGGCRKAIRTSLIRDNQIEYSRDPVGEEALYSFRLLYLAQSLSFLEKPYYHYLNHPNSQSKKPDDDPYGNVLLKLRNYLTENDLLKEYQKTLRSFAFTSLIVSIYRLVMNHPLRDAIRESRIGFRKFRSQYGFDLDKDSLETRVRLMIPLARFHLVTPIIWIAKIKLSLRK